MQTVPVSVRSMRLWVNESHSITTLAAIYFNASCDDDCRDTSFNMKIRLLRTYTLQVDPSIYLFTLTNDVPGV
jgi:GH43 family beta-xylosidase